MAPSTEYEIYISNKCIGGSYIYELDYIDEEVRWMRKSWFIPRKIQLRNQHIKRADNYRNRNNLPFKFRKNENQRRN